MASFRKDTIGAESGGRVPGQFPGARLPEALTVTEFMPFQGAGGWRGRIAPGARSGKIFRRKSPSSYQQPTSGGSCFH